MNRNRFLALLAGAAVTSLAAVPAFAEGPSENASVKAKAAVAGEKANRGLAALAKRRAVQGELTAAKAVSNTVVELTLKTKRADAFVVVADADTVFRGKGHEDLTLAGLKDLELGTRIIAQGERDGEKLVAKHLIVRPAKQEKEDKDENDDAAKRTVTVGVIGGITTNSSNVITGFTVTPQGGSAVTYVANTETQYHLKGTAQLDKLTVRVVSKKDGTNNVALQVRYPAGA